MGVFRFVLAACRLPGSVTPGPPDARSDYGAATHDKTEKSWTGWRRLSAHGDCYGALLLCPHGDWLGHVRIQCTASDGVCLIGMPGTSSHMAGQQLPKLPSFCTCCGRACGQLFAQNAWPALYSRTQSLPGSYGAQARRTGHPSISCCGVWLQSCRCTEERMPSVWSCAHLRDAARAPPLVLPWQLLTEPDTQLVPYGSPPSHSG
ncbi:hypothetical protein J3F83DRAFT_727874 [Trichoderma novae-zelandiae]